MKIQNIIKQYKEWKEGHDEGYIYDQIHDFVNDLSRGDLLQFMEAVEKIDRIYDLD